MTDTYIIVAELGDMFADSTYQRELDYRRAGRMAEAWDPRLAGVLDVSDRGENVSPRYAIINGQHRWSAAARVPGLSAMPVNVHTGLTIEDEAALFYSIDRGTRALTNWDRWYARRAAGDENVAAIEKITTSCGLVVTQNPGPRSIQCCSTLERIWTRCDPMILTDTLQLLLDVWPADDEALRAVIVEGLATLLNTYVTDIDNGRVGDALSDMTPRQLLARSRDLQERGQTGSVPRLIARVLVTAYNRRPGTKLDMKALG